MIDKLVVHIKNIIFFKLVVYLLLIVILALLFPIFVSDLEKASQRKQKAYSSLRETTLKIKSIEDFEEKIATLNKNYNALTTTKGDVGCINRTKFIKEIESFTTKYKLFEPVSIKIYKDIEREELLSSNTQVKIKYHVANIQFKARDHYSLLVMSKDLFSIMPPSSAVLAINIRSIDILTPKIVEELKKEQAPDLLEVTIRILLRDIVYEK